MWGLRSYLYKSYNGLIKSNCPAMVLAETIGRRSRKVGSGRRANKGIPGSGAPPNSLIQKLQVERPHLRCVKYKISFISGPANRQMKSLLRGNTFPWNFNKKLFSQSRGMGIMPNMGYLNISNNTTWPSICNSVN